MEILLQPQKPFPRLSTTLISSLGLVTPRPSHGPRSDSWSENTRSATTSRVPPWRKGSTLVEALSSRNQHRVSRARARIASKVV